MKWKHALVSHILQNQTKDPWRWHITQADQDRAHLWKVDGRWWKWNTPFMNLSLLYLDNMRTWLYIFFSLFLFSWTLMCPFFSLFFGSCFLGMPSFLSFFDSPCLIWKILERQRSLEFYFVDGWNGITDFQCRSSAGGVHMILIKQVWNASH